MLCRVQAQLACKELWQACSYGLFLWLITQHAHDKTPATSRLRVLSPTDDADVAWVPQAGRCGSCRVVNDGGCHHLPGSSSRLNSCCCQRRAQGTPRQTCAHQKEWARLKRMLGSRPALGCCVCRETVGISTQTEIIVAAGCSTGISTGIMK